MAFRSLTLGRCCSATLRTPESSPWPKAVVGRSRHLWSRLGTSQVDAFWTLPQQMPLIGPERAVLSFASRSGCIGNGSFRLGGPTRQRSLLRDDCANQVCELRL